MTQQHSAKALAEMDASAIESKFQDLDAASVEALVRRANREYWALSNPTLPDPLYDRLVAALRRLDPDNAILGELGEAVPKGPVLDAVDAADIPPQQRLGAPVRHRFPMLSLDKCYTGEDLMSWAAKFEGEVVVMPKMDGIACSLRYRRGALYLAATRGNGREGEDITVNALDIEDVPNGFEDAQLGTLDDLEVRGEIYMRLSVFERYKGTYSNPRNLTAGAVKHKERGRTADYTLSFFPYDLRAPELGLEHESEKLACLARMGFTTDEMKTVARDSLVESFQEFSRIRPALDYEIDGVVYRAASLAEQDRMGETGHHPRWSIAFKFQGDTGQTTLRDIAWSVSRTGTITPVAMLEPIELSGAMVGRASLHNLSIFEALAPTKGATVEVTRRGGVIPNIERVVEAGPGAVRFELPSHCPACNGPVERRKVREAEFLYCANPDTCISARMGELAHFAKVVDIQGFGPKIIAQCVDKGLLSSPADYYKLTMADLETLDRLGRRSAQNLVDQVRTHRRLELAVFLQALGVDHLGRQFATVLEREFGTLQRIRTLTIADLVEVKGIKDAIAHSLVTGLEDRGELIDDLLAHVEVIEPDPSQVGEEPEEPTPAGPLGGKRFLFTGTLESFTRKEAQQKIEGGGGVAATAVNKELDYLVVGSGRGAKSSKQKKAEKLIDAGAALRIISEADFLGMLGE